MWPAPGIITKLWASPSGEAFAVMPGSALQRFDGVRWTVVPIDLSQLFGNERGALWAAGNCGGIAVHTASGWELTSSPLSMITC
jgi:hypothetical protein